jgi:predicted nucleic acid-binding protein
MAAKVFLDANVLFSAAYREQAGLLTLWSLKNVALLTSGYAAEEARRNLDSEDAQERLRRLLEKVEIVSEALGNDLPDEIKLPAKDQPILLAAIAAGATHLLTGDVSDFGAYFGKRIQGVRIQTPGQFLVGRREK